MSKKLWAGRFATATNTAVDKYTASISFDNQLAMEDILGSLAHAAMLHQCGILDTAAHTQIQHGLQNIAHKIVTQQLEFNVTDEDIHMNIERLLSDAIGTVAGKLHTARSRNDQVALDLHLYLRNQLITILDLLVKLQETLLQIAQQHCHTILPGYTHLQRAQPVYLAQHLLAYVAMLQRDIERLQGSWGRINSSPLGACALAGTTLPTDPLYVASQLGFEGIYSNTLDAVSDRDFIIEFLANAALIMMHMSRLSEELILWSSQEFNFISFDDAYATGSSIMPQKKNPDVAELGRGKTGRVYGALFTLLTIMKGLPLAYNKDLQEDKEPLFDTVTTLRDTLAIYIPLLTTLKINTAAMRQATDTGFLNATALAEYLVTCGITFREAHAVTGKMVAFCMQHNCHLEDLSLPQMQQFAAVITENVYQVLIMENIVANYHAADNFKEYAQQLTLCNNWITEKRTMLANVYANFNLNIAPCLLDL